MERVQQFLIERIGVRDTRVLLLMLNPAFDTPARLGHVFPDIPTDRAVALPDRAKPAELRMVGI